MSIFAGIYSRKKSNPVPDALRGDLKSLISRHADEHIQEFGDDRFFSVKVDIGAFGEEGYFVDADGGVSLIAGEALLELKDGETWQSRTNDLAKIHAAFEAGNYDTVRGADGVFCCVNYFPFSGTIMLTADKLGIRPLYYFADENYLVFSTALRVLEGLSIVPKRLDLRALTEIAGFGYALSDRTPYCDIRYLGAGEIVTVKDNNQTTGQYWKWNEIAASSASEEELLTELYRRFDRAVARRIRSDSSAIAFLSGGLDSRCVVAALCNQNAHVHTFNFSRPSTQDQILGRQFAAEVAVTHSEVAKEAGDIIPDYSMLLANVWKDSKAAVSRPPERETLVWSGEGGSLGLGHIHLGRKIVRLMYEGQTEAAILEYLEREGIYVSPNLMPRDVYERLADAVPRGIAEELSKLQMSDPPRSYYLYLMLNDQRRKLAGHFENMDQHRLEFQLPFFDSSVLELIVSIPFELCVEHKLYVKWLKLFQPPVSSVAWQAYPGHQPCPIRVPDGLSYQWDDGYQMSEKSSIKRTLYRQAVKMLKSPNFPSSILSRKNLFLAAVAHRTSLRDYGYFIETANIFYKYSRKCNVEQNP